MRKILLFLLGCIISSHMHLSTQNEFVLIEPDYVSYTNSISSDGKYVVGKLGAYIGFLWDTETRQTTLTSATGLPKDRTDALDVNNDGIVVGDFRNPDLTIRIEDLEEEDGVIRDIPITVAGVFKDDSWTSLGIGNLELSQLTSFENGSYTSAISTDGSTVAGALMAAGYNVTPCVWNYNNASQKWDYTIYSYPGETSQGSRILGLSGDGSIACGWTSNLWGAWLPIVWKSPTEYIIVGEDDFFFGFSGTANKVSENGRYVAMQLNQQAAVYFVEEDEYLFIPLPADAQSSSATAVSDNGLVIGYSQYSNFDGDWRVPFVYSEELGFMELNEFINTFAGDIQLPDNELIDFTSEGRLLSVPMDISSDGKSITGWSGFSAQYRISWLLRVETELEILNRPQNLSGTVSDRNKVHLTWEPPVADPENEITGYRVYRNGKLIASLELVTEYTDEAPGGHHEYGVAAEYGNINSPSSDKALISVVDTYELPFFENFDSVSLKTNFWTLDNDDIRWTLSDFSIRGIYMYGVTLQNGGLQMDYSQRLMSKPLDATEHQNVYLSFALKYVADTDITPDTLGIEVYNGEEWVSVKKYALNMEEYGWNVENIDLSEFVAGKLFQVGFRGYGKDLGFMAIDIDNIRVDTELRQGDLVEGLTGEVKGQEVELLWENTLGAYELGYYTYDPSEQLMVVGNQGAPFIAAIGFDPADLDIYKGKYLSYISAYIEEYDNTGLPVKVALVVYENNEKTVEQPVEFIPNQFNTFLLDNPVYVDGTKNLKFGIKLTQHDATQRPVGYQYTPTPVKGKSDLYSEDNGNTWMSISDVPDLEYMTCNWAFTGGMTDEALTELPQIETLALAYNIYRDGEKINPTLHFSSSYTDENAVENACYTVTAYYLNGTESDNSEEFCITELSIENNISDENSLIIFPNPAVDNITIEGSFTKATLMDMNGRIILETSGNNLNVSPLAEGIYLIRIETLQGNVTQKLIIRK